MASKLARSLSSYNPSRDFPLELRKQIFLPDFTITLVRTPFLPPRYATFWVPLSFNKLDLKDYLKRAYNVDVLKIRSYVEQQNVTREKPRGREGAGAIRRPMSKKKMTVEMTEPFVWPEEPEDYSPWERDTYFASEKAQREYGESTSADAKMKFSKRKRELLAEQAEQTLKNPETFQPTWQAVGLNYNRPQLRTSKPLGPPSQPPQKTAKSQEPQEPSES